MATPDPMVSTAIDLASKGTGWVVAVYLFKLLLAEKDKRLEDSRVTMTLITDPLKNIQKTLDLIFDQTGKKSNG